MTTTQDSDFINSKTYTLKRSLERYADSLRRGIVRDVGAADDITDSELSCMVISYEADTPERKSRLWCEHAVFEGCRAAEEAIDREGGKGGGDYHARMALRCLLNAYYHRGAVGSWPSALAHDAAAELEQWVTEKMGAR